MILPEAITIVAMVVAWWFIIEYGALRGRCADRAERGSVDRRRNSEGEAPAVDRT
jgi:hypothetical protein